MLARARRCAGVASAVAAAATPLAMLARVASTFARYSRCRSISTLVETTSLEYLDWARGGVWEGNVGGAWGGRGAAHAPAHPRSVRIHGRVRLLPRDLALEVHEVHLEAGDLGGRLGLRRPPRSSRGTAA